MNSISRGIRNAFRNAVRTISIVLILGLSTGLVLTMLAARQAVSDKIETIKSASGNTISISPAGVRGFDGGGTALTSEQLAKVAAVTHVTKVVNSLNDRLSSTDTNLVSAVEAGAFGARQQAASGTSSDAAPAMPADAITTTTDGATTTTTPRAMPLMVTGVNDTSAIETGATITWKSGAAFDATADKDVAVLGSGIATKNNLSVGSTFTAYGSTITVVGIYDTGTTFGNNGVYFPLVALQRLSSQAGAITATTAYVDSSDNLASATSAIKSALGSAIDVTNSQDTADATAKPLESVKTITLWSTIGAVVAGAVIILLTMMMIVRERRREIGVMKAIGASNVKIMGQFIVEAITLTVLGLVIGIIIGIAAAAPLTKTLVQTSSSSTTSTSQQGGPGGAPGGIRTFSRSSRQVVQNVTASVGASTLAMGVGAAVLIAIIGSAVPSFAISKIKPAEAMRNE